MIWGISCSLLWIFRHFPFFCHISGEIIYILLQSQGTSIGIYQLSRLYYCFAQEKVHNNNGYPRWLFIIMYTIGFGIMINATIVPWILFYDKYKLECGINNQYQYYQTELKYSWSAAIWSYILLACFIIWDMMTLLLYSIKVIQFRFEFNLRSKQDQDQKTSSEATVERIMSILNRILVLTMLYEIPWVIYIAMKWIPYDTHWVLNVLLFINYFIVIFMMSYSVFLMQSHNTKEYEKFLSILYERKLYYIGCCCFGNMIKNDLYSLNSMNSSIVDTKEIETKIPGNNKQKTMTETRTNTILDPNIAIKPTLSIHSIIEE